MRGEENANDDYTIARQRAGPQRESSSLGAADIAECRPAVSPPHRAARASGRTGRCARWVSARSHGNARIVTRPLPAGKLALQRAAPLGEGDNRVRIWK